MKKSSNIFTLLLVVVLIYTLCACGSAGVNQPGDEPRGSAGNSVSDNPNALSVPASGSVPYYYADTEEERTRAMNEITTNPFPITAEGLARAKPCTVKM